MRAGHAVVLLILAVNVIAILLWKRFLHAQRSRLARDPDDPGGDDPGD
ncbi:MAG: hypothetical protein HY567_01810 [Candidatus Kerfeldbacteria bacterium]|nr:hypothetical protein [Candidatus Kerfeldbacteria bacterium]